VFKGQFTRIPELQLINQNNSVCHHIVVNFHGTNFYTSCSFFEGLSLYSPHVLYLMTLILFLQFKHVLTTYSADCKIEKRGSCLFSLKCTVETVTSTSASFPILYNSTFTKHQNFRHWFYNLLWVKSKKHRLHGLTTFLFFRSKYNGIYFISNVTCGDTSGHRKIYLACSTVWILTRRLQLGFIQKSFTSMRCSVIFFFPEVRHTPLSSAVVDRWRRYNDTVIFVRTFTTLP